MKYYQSNHTLIQHNDTTGVYRIRNTINKTNNILSQEQFDLLEPVRIKKSKFCELVNLYFKSLKHEWEFENSTFKKLDNFDANGNSSGFNWTDIPLHNVDGYSYSTIKIAYHWGRVYYMLCGGNYFPKVQLVDIRTLKTVQWADIKNLSPVFNIGTKKLV